MFSTGMIHEPKKSCELRLSNYAHGSVQQMSIKSWRALSRLSRTASLYGSWKTLLSKAGKVVNPTHKHCGVLVILEQVRQSWRRALPATCASDTNHPALVFLCSFAIIRVNRVDSNQHLQYCDPSVSRLYHDFPLRNHWSILSKQTSRRAWACAQIAWRMMKLISYKQC